MCEHTQKERAATAETAKVGTLNQFLPCKKCSIQPCTGESPNAYSATLCDAHILQDKTSLDTCSISP